MYLRANGFKTYIVSGGGVEFMRAWVEQALRHPARAGGRPEQTSKVKSQNCATVRPVLVKLPELDFIDDKGEGKPVAINKFIGRRPIAAFGNSDGDLQMLQWTTGGSGARFPALIVHHTDDKREWAYDRKSSIGRLDKALDEAKAKGWTVVEHERRLEDHFCAA